MWLWNEIWALNEYNKAIQYWFENAWVYDNIAFSYEYLGDYLNAVENINKAINLADWDTYSLNLRKAQILYNVWDFFECIEVCNKIIWKNPWDKLFSDLKSECLIKING
jgi:tetratricopeptide (TPR) repeat protein